jgi:hypothetical protein
MHRAATFTCGTEFQKLLDPVVRADLTGETRKGASVMAQADDLPGSWGQWGEDDEAGTLNLITDAVRARAAAEVRTGRAVSDPASVRRAAAQIIELGLPIVALLNNAGIAQTRPTKNALGWDMTFATNRLRPFELTEALAPHLPDGTQVVFMCSGVKDPEHKPAVIAGFREGRYIPAKASARGEWAPGGPKLPAGEVRARAVGTVHQVLEQPEDGRPGDHPGTYRQLGPHRRLLRRKEPADERFHARARPGIQRTRGRRDPRPAGTGPRVTSTRWRRPAGPKFPSDRPPN